LLKAHADDVRAFLIWAEALLPSRTQRDNAKARRAFADALAATRMYRPICSA
jgi:hypothetical protein